MGCYASRRQRPDLVATSFETSALPKPITNKAGGFSLTLRGNSPAGKTRRPLNTQWPAQHTVDGLPVDGFRETGQRTHHGLLILGGPHRRHGPHQVAAVALRCESRIQNRHDPAGCAETAMNPLPR